MIIKLKGTIKLIKTEFDKVSTILFEEYFPKTDLTMTHYLTCFENTYTAHRKLIDNSTYKRGVDTFMVDVISTREKKISKQAVYKEGHEKAGQPFEYYQDKYILHSIKKI